MKKLRWPKPAKRSPKSPRPLKRGGRVARKTPVRKRSNNRARVEAADSVWSGKVKGRSHEGLCQCGCGYMGDCAHHLWPKGAHPNLRYDVENGAWLRRTCHRRVHDVIGLETFRLWLLPRDVYIRLKSEAA